MVGNVRARSRARQLDRGGWGVELPHLLHAERDSANLAIRAEGAHLVLDVAGDVHAFRVMVAHVQDHDSLPLVVVADDAAGGVVQ